MTDLNSLKQDSNSLENIGLGISHSKDQYLTFLLRDEVYAVDILCVEEIRGWDEPTLIPNSPSYIKGVINLRGRIVPVSDLRERFSIGETSYDATTVVIILTIQVNDKERQMGIVVDAVSDVVNGNGGDLEKVSGLSSSEASRFVSGLLNVEDHVISVLDLEPLLAIEENKQVKLKESSGFDKKSRIKVSSNIPLNQDANSTAHLAGEYLSFMVDGEEYAVDILCVQEIRGWQPLRAIPNTPSYVKGVINLRNTIVPIIDMRERFGFDLKEYSATTVVIVLRSLQNLKDASANEKVIGVIVDAVSEVYDLKDEQIQDAPDFGSSIDTKFIKGMADVGDKLIVLLDLEKFHNFDQMQSLKRLQNSEGSHAEFTN